MSRRFLLIPLLVAINVAIIVAIVWHQRTHQLTNTQLADAGLNSARLAEFGLVESITPAEFQDATNALVQERQMWSRFNGMSADMSVKFEGNDGNHLSLEGNVSLRQLDLSPTERTNLIAKYDMIISDKQGAWKVTTDGAPTNTVITCQDPQVSEAIKTIGPASMLYLLTFPQYCLGTLYRDKPYPPAVSSEFYTFNRFLESWKLLLMTNTVPYSYTFLTIFHDRNYVNTDFAFKKGHIYQWRRMQASPGYPMLEKLAIYFENPVELNGFWYPTVIQMTPAPTSWPYPYVEQGAFAANLKKGKGQLCITLSNVSINAK